MYMYMYTYILGVYIDTYILGRGVYPPEQPSLTLAPGVSACPSIALVMSSQRVDEVFAHSLQANHRSNHRYIYLYFCICMYIYIHIYIYKRAWGLPSRVAVADTNARRECMPVDRVDERPPDLPLPPYHTAAFKGVS